ncbi:MAG: DUF2461 domain-containing protein [Deltaproteobacteria bacterium]|jgi:uncharacterized protein (TIGR02453 family)|nr:DUF2461 domain-containing protein [Deltaproteobacteria bacterium]
MSSPRLNKESLRLLACLENCTDRKWYKDNKDKIEKNIIEPARELVTSVGAILNSRVKKEVIADPKIDRSIYRLHRDTRFSSDKSPYKGHLGLIWWSDYPEGKLESPCFYFQISSNRWIWSVGCYAFPPDMLKAYRDVLLDFDRFLEFQSITVSLSLKAGFNQPDPDIRTVPAGFKKNSYYQEWCNHTGLYTWRENTNEAELFSSDAADIIAKNLLIGADLYHWLVNLRENSWAQRRKTELEQQPVVNTAQDGTENHGSTKRIHQDDF